MGAPRYRYGHKLEKRRPRKALLVLSGSVLMLALLAGVVFWDLRKHVSPTVEGESRVVSQVLSDNAQQKLVDEPFFSFELPGDWKETGRNTNSQYTSISWQATAKDKDNRYLTVYIDRIPTDMPLNRIVTVKAQGNGLSFSEVSDNCANFTVGGSFETRAAATSRPTLTKWNKVDFMCNLPRVIDNEVGTGSEGAPNSVTVTGPNKGAHRYFFLYTDRNYQPDYTIFYDVLRSFRAK